MNTSNNNSNQISNHNSNNQSITNGIPIEKKSNRLWTAHFIKALLVTFSISICYHSQLSILPLYAQHIGGNQMVSGMMMGAYTLSALLFRPLVGNLCDQRGRKIVLIMGIALFAAVSFLYSYAYLVWFLIALRFVHGASFSAYSTATGTIIADIVPKRRLMEGIGYSGLSNTLAMAIGPALGLYLISVAGYSMLFRIIFVISVIGLILSFLINYEDKGKLQDPQDAPHHSAKLQPSKDERERESKPESKKKRILIEKSALPPSLVMFFTSMAQVSVAVFLPTYALSRGVNDIGLFFTVYAVVLLVSRPIIGKLSDQIGPSKILIPAIIVFAAAMVHMAYSSNLSSFLLDAVLYGLGQGALYPVLNGLAIKLSRPEHLGAANSTFYSSIDLGYGIGSILLGAVLQVTGFTVIYFASATFNLIALLLYIGLFVWRKPLRGN